MCGITGFLNTSPQQPSEEMRATIGLMSDTLLHRGPDDEGHWVDPSAGVALGFRRLSIIDLSPEGHQPMASADGRYVLIFNGEIYNFRELRRELAAYGHSFRGHSDTEIMLAAFSEWGFERALRAFNGMFAMALWDSRERVLHLTRDRLGEKPLYYGFAGETFLFGSELKALRAHPDFRAEIDRDALALFLRYNYIPAPYSIYKNIYKLGPGTYITLDAGRSSHGSSSGALGQPPAPKPYWSAREVAEAGVAEPFAGTESQAVSELEKLLSDAVGLRMVTDVPLGAFLSGGVDSSTIVALMQAQSSQPVRTFSIGFTDEAYDEARYASAVARHLKTDHTELYVTPEDALAVIPRLPALYDEPFSDSSQIPTFLVSQLARRHVTVSLSGDGGDELFAGYTRYLLGQSVWNKIGWMPRAPRTAAAGALTTVSPQAWDRAFTGLKPFLPSRLRQRAPGDKLHKLAEILAVPDTEAMYMSLVSHWKEPTALVRGASEPPTTLTDAGQWANLPDFIQ